MASEKPDTTTVVPLLPEELRLAIDDAIDKLAAKDFKADPICGLHYSRTTSIVSSAYKRHGKLIELALSIALRKHGFKVWTEPRFLVSRAADDLAGDDESITAALPYGRRNRSIQVDLVVIQLPDGTLGAYECKRGFGYHDAGKKRSMLRDLRCIRMLLRSYGDLVLGLQPKAVDAKLISYYGVRDLPPEWQMVGGELDEHFGVVVTPTIEAGNRYFSDRLANLLERS